MRRMPTRTGLTLACIALAAHLASAQTPAPARLSSIAWLQGCWQDATPERTIQELWMPPLGDAMAGLGRTVRAGHLVEFEAVVIREGPSGLTYEAHPSGQAEASFATKSMSERSIVFENPAHDFPQRIGYGRPASSTLTAWIEGSVGGKMQRVEFRYTRVACP
jgi:hypothetical protein